VVRRNPSGKFSFGKPSEASAHFKIGKLDNFVICVNIDWLARGPSAALAKKQ
jgi:hypothetical protein